MSFRPYDLLNLVNRFGEPLTLNKVTTSGTYNPANGTVTGSATTNYSSSLAVVPDDEDQITGNGDTVNVLSVVTIFSNGIAICYICDVRE